APVRRRAGPPEAAHAAGARLRPDRGRARQAPSRELPGCALGSPDRRQVAATAAAGPPASGAATRFCLGTSSIRGPAAALGAARRRRPTQATSDRRSAEPPAVL